MIKNTMYTFIVLIVILPAMILLPHSVTFAKDWTKPGIFKGDRYHFHSGSFSNYTYTPVFYKTINRSIYMQVKTNSKRKGSFKAFLQRKTSHGWQTIKTLTIQKNTHNKYQDCFTLQKGIKNKTKLRLKFVNSQPQQQVHYTFKVNY